MFESRAPFFPLYFVGTSRAPFFIFFAINGYVTTSSFAIR